jgi:signal transduction histidine kinase
MPQPVKLSDALVEDARQTSEVAERSIASQIEHWARLGRVVDALLRGDEALALKKRLGARPLSHLLDVDSEAGHARFHAHMNARPFPRFERDEADPTLFVRIDEDGTRTRGRLAGRTFEPLSA